LRSSGRLNVQAVAGSLGGGGHFRAAGLSCHGSLSEAIRSVEAALVAQGL
jgi:c-di-AMP phosphodiesterase-like protein